MDESTAIQSGKPSRLVDEGRSLIRRLGDFRDDMPGRYMGNAECNEFNSLIDLIESLIYLVQSDV